MYDEIKKPRLLKDFPLLFIRALPSLYYFSKFAGQDVPDKVRKLFVTNTKYLSSATELVGQNLKNEDFICLSSSIAQLNDLPRNEILSNLEEITIMLSKLCAEFREDIRQLMRTIKPFLIEVYNSTVLKINVLVIDNNNEPEKVNKLANTLENFCYYQVNKTPHFVRDYTSKWIETDFVVFASIVPPQIHDEVKSLETYKKPGLAVAHLEKDSELNKQAIRHGSQLLKIGFPVLFKIFTPIRLFTTIDKNYMRFHLS